MKQALQNLGHIYMATLYGEPSLSLDPVKLYSTVTVGGHITVPPQQCGGPLLVQWEKPLLRSYFQTWAYSSSQGK